MGSDHEPVTSFYEKAYGIEEHQTKDFYAQWAATYDEELVAGRGYAMPQRCRDAFATHVPDTDVPVIDLGCGTGLLGSQLADLGFSTLDGIDYSPEMLAQAQQLDIYRALWAADLNEPLEIDDGAYGAVAAMGVFSFGHVHADALAEMSRILAPGGILVVGVNEVFVDQGTLVPQLERLEAEGTLEILSREYGAHMPASEVNGWVYVARRA